jgi:hypothetical protein
MLSTSETLFDYYSIETFKMANNRLQMYPSFKMNEINSSSVETFLEIDLNRNQLNQIKYFSFIYGRLKVANFDINNISSIETDAFLNCRSLEFLSIAKNRLKSINENNFHFLFSLIQLNLSFNEIEFIENSSFKNLNKLKSLDLNYNRLISIQNDLFAGLLNLKDLHLMMMSQENEMIIFNQNSFKHLPNISSIYLNESLIQKYKCLFMNDLERDVQRNVSNKFIFFKSINLISENVSFFKTKCDLMFHLFQFRIHFNLKTDNENDLFYESCQKVLIVRENNFNHTKSKCDQTFVFIDRENIEDVEFAHPIILMLSNFYFLLTMAAIISLLGPVFCLIVRYELLSNLIAFLCKDQLTEEEKILREHELENEKKREKLKRMRSQYQKQIEKLQHDLLDLERNLPEPNTIHKTFNKNSSETHGSKEQDNLRRTNLSFAQPQIIDMDNEEQHF